MTSLEPPRPKDRSATLGRHAAAEAMRLGALSGIGLVGSLHVGQPFAVPPEQGRHRGYPSHRWSPSGPGMRRCFPAMLGAIGGFPLVGSPTEVYVHSTAGPLVVHTCGPRCGRHRPAWGGGAG